MPCPIIIKIEVPVRVDTFNQYIVDVIGEHSEQTLPIDHPVLHAD